MYVQRNLSRPVIFSLSWKPLLFQTAWSSLVVAAHRILPHYGYHFVLPLEPISLMGIAVAFYLGFKNEKAYARFWEARTLWGGIVNYSRSWANAVLSYLDGADLSEGERSDVERSLIMRHVAWLHALTLNLRKKAPASPDYSSYPRNIRRDHTQAGDFERALSSYIDDSELAEVTKHSNIPAQLLRFQGRQLRWLALERRWLNTFYHAEMTRLLEELYNLQGACERIKNTPLPRQYSHTSHTFVLAFCLLLPIGLMGPIGSTTLLEDFLGIMLSVLVSWTFLISEKVGDTSEDPFENFMFDVPMSTLSRMIEIDLREMIQDSEIPAPLQPVDGVLF